MHVAILCLVITVRLFYVSIKKNNKKNELKKNFRRTLLKLVYGAHAIGKLYIFIVGVDRECIFINVIHIHRISGAVMESNRTKLIHTSQGANLFNTLSEVSLMDV